MFPLSSFLLVALFPSRSSHSEMASESRNIGATSEDDEIRTVVRMRGQETKRMPSSVARACHPGGGLWDGLDGFRCGRRYVFQALRGWRAWNAFHLQSGAGRSSLFYFILYLMFQIYNNVFRQYMAIVTGLHICLQFLQQLASILQAVYSAASRLLMLSPVWAGYWPNKNLL